jgi:hypothetical protein
MLRAASLALVLAAGGASLAAEAAAQPIFDPSDAKGASELSVESHGKTMRAAVSGWGWCPEQGDACQQGVVDYAYEPDPERLPFHPRSLVRLETGRPARAVVVTFTRAGKDARLRAKRRDDSGLRWIVRAPRRANEEQDLTMVADYRYRKDEKWYGGRYSFFLPARMHRHR